MKIMLIIPTLGYGGAESLVLNWIRDWLDSDRVRSIVLVLYSADFASRLGEMANHPKFKLIVEDTNTPWQIMRPRYLLHLWRLRRIIREEAPDVIHCHLVAGLDLAFIRRWLRQPPLIVFTCHGIVEKNSKKSYQRIEKRFFNSKNVVAVCVSPTLQKFFENFYQSPSRVIWNGSPVVQTSVSGDALRRELLTLPAEQSPNRKIFLAVGRVMRQKNYEMLTAVFRRLYEKKTDVMLVVLGDFVSERNREIYEPMKAQNIFFMGRKDNVPEFLAAADFYCTASIYEGCSIALTEAMAAKIVPVVTKVPGIVDVISDREHGIIADDLSEESYERAVLAALALGEDEKARIVQNNYTFYRENLVMEVCSKRYLDLFDEYLGERRGLSENGRSRTGGSAKNH